MQPDDQNKAPPTGERVEARGRLARQIGRLLASEWLQKRQSAQGQFLQDDAASSAHDNGANDS